MTDPTPAGRTVPVTRDEAFALLGGALDLAQRQAADQAARADYCRLARWRTTDPGQIAKAARRPAPPKQVEGQEGLFEIGEAA